MAQRGIVKTYRRNGYEYYGTQVGGQTVYLARADKVNKRRAETMFCQYVALIRAGIPRDQALSQVRGEATPTPVAGKSVVPHLDELDERDELLAVLARKPKLAEYNVWRLAEEYLAWGDQHLSPGNMASKPTFLNHFCRHRVSEPLPGSGEQIGDLHPLVVSAVHVADFIDHQRGRPRACPRCHSVAGEADCPRCRGKNVGEPIGDKMLHEYSVHVKACWNWAAEKGIFPHGFRPLAAVKNVVVPKKDKKEENLPTPEEYDALLSKADKVHAGFGSVIRFYREAGARTSELAIARVRDVSFKRSEITLTYHKRMKSQSVTTTRKIPMSEPLTKLVRSLCAGKGQDDFLVYQRNGSPWNKDRLDHVFRQVRKAAGVREEITPYSFRDLWISDLLQHTTANIGQIADMAGTSTEMVERYYGHFRNEAKLEALRLMTDARKRRERRVIA